MFHRALAAATACHAPRQVIGDEDAVSVVELRAQDTAEQGKKRIA
jgi:hypothetical protein